MTLGDPPGLPGLLHHTLPDYKAVRGIGNVKAIQLAAVGELSRRIWKAVRSGRELVFDHPAVIADYFMEEMRHMEQEHVKLLVLNTEKCADPGCGYFQGDGQRLPGHAQGAVY